MERRGTRFDAAPHQIFLALHKIEHIIPLYRALCARLPPPSSFGGFLAQLARLRFFLRRDAWLHRFDTSVLLQ